MRTTLARRSLGLTAQTAPVIRRGSCAAFAVPAPLDYSPWLNAHEAAAYLRCPVSRVRKLTMTRELPCEHDGRRVLYHREALDGFVRRGGATCP
jgi:excisionase family DNA binding protein